MDRDFLEFKYNTGGLMLESLMKMVEDRKISEADFHWITGYSYKGLIASKTQKWDTYR